VIVKAQERRPLFNTRLVLVGLVLIIAMIGLWWWNTSTPVPTLQDAIVSGIITAEFSGTGGSSGDSVRAQVAKGPNSGLAPVAVIIPAGSILVSNDEDAQNMTVVSVRGVDLGGKKYRPESRIVLTDKEPVTYVLAAYCTQFEKANPSFATRFTLKKPDPVLSCIAQQGPSLTVPAMQAAVWMRTENITLVHMNEKFSVTAQEWDAGQSVFQRCRNAEEPNAAPVP
jgi:hypothetical protein